MDVYGLIGSPVEHSLSPPMHEAAYDELDLDARYVTFEPADGAAAVEAAAELGIAGLNVTIPFKQDVLAAVEPDDAAARVGAVNTIDFGTDPPRGYNTDLAGVRRSFEHHDVDLEGATVVQVGAGGAGRAVAFAATDAGATVRIANRTESKADDLAADVADASDGLATDDGTVSGHGLDAVPELLAGADVLVNATSVGMEGDESPVAAEALHGDLVVFDAVYSPLETRLLRDAAAAGAETIDGAWMLLFQGVAAFERWTGRGAPVDAMNRALRAHLE